MERTSAPTSKSFPRPTQSSKRDSVQGFTLLETVMAIGILAIIVTNILGTYASSVAVTQTSIDNMKASWVLRSILAQIEYKVDTRGVKDSFPAGETKFQYGTEPVFNVAVVVKDPPIEGSRFLQAAVRMQGALQGSGDEEGGGGGGMAEEFVKQFGSQIDAALPREMYRSIQITVSWEQGESTRSLQTGVFLIDDQQLPKPGSLALPGGSGGGSGGSADEDSGG